MARRNASAEHETNDAVESQVHRSEFDEVASEARDVGQLAEPLADSVLNYTLRRLKPNEVNAPLAVQVLEKTAFPETISQLMDEDTTFVQQPLQPQGAGAETSLMIFDRQSGDTAAVPHAYAYGDRDGIMSMPAVDSNGLDWWELSLDNIQQPILPYEELFNLDVNTY